MLDPRGVRFAATLTTIVLVLVLVTGSAWLALAQAAVFALTAASPARGPYALLYRAVLAPRLGPPADREDAAPVRFAQLIGFCFALGAGLAYLWGLVVLGAVLAGAALAAAFLNAAFGLCLGCQLYLAARRLTSRA
ncbi:MAG TPA: DUF4395 domain-containing protein [Natronosporangium sp.]|nr:DUF4395 domain-containing protein [Natronosporangium sp.]